MSNHNPSELKLALCDECGAFTFPVDTPGCRQCGAFGTSLRPVSCPASPRLRNFVTVHSALAPGLQVPCVVGEVVLAPGVVEEALLTTTDENSLTLGQSLVARNMGPHDADPQWVFEPVGEEDK